MKGGTNTNRITELDALRGIAALLVVIFHYMTRFNEVYGHDFGYTHALSPLRLGVQLFFIISGFVIYLTIRKQYTASAFLYRRFTRLYPIYWVAVLLTFSIVHLIGLPGREAAFNNFLWNLTMFHELWKVPHVDGVYWSLLPELMFYLMLAVLLLLKSAERLWWISAIWVILVVGQLQFGVFPELWAKVLNLQYGMLFLAGMHFYALFQGEQHGGHHFYILLCFWLTSLQYSLVFEQLLLFLFFGSFYLFVYGQLKWLARRPLIWLGQISYALYLIHQNLGYIVLYQLKEYFGYTSRWMVLVPIILIAAIAHLLTFYVERPMMRRLRSRSANE